MFFSQISQGAALATTDATRQKTLQQVYGIKAIEVSSNGTELYVVIPITMHSLAFKTLMQNNININQASNLKLSTNNGDRVAVVLELDQTQFDRNTAAKQAAAAAAVSTVSPATPTSAA